MNRSVRFLFDDRETAAQALILVVDDARVTKHFYRFGSLSADQIYASGLLLMGEVDEVVSKLSQLSGAQLISS